MGTETEMAGSEMTGSEMVGSKTTKMTNPATTRWVTVEHLDMNGKLKWIRVARVISRRYVFSKRRWDDPKEPKLLVREWKKTSGSFNKPGMVGCQCPPATAQELKLAGVPERMW